MTIRTISQILFLSTTILLACSPNDNSTVSEENLQQETSQIQIQVSPDSVLSNDANYFGDSLLPIFSKQIKYYIKQYDTDTCVPQTKSKGQIRDILEGLYSIGDINGDGIDESIFILNPLNWCEYDSGQSYYFTDTSLPRLVSGSYCCHPTNVFRAPDIDEDGVNEIGYYYSSCASRYKSVHLVSLKSDNWVEIGVSDFDIMTQNPEGFNFETLVKKISKGTFSLKNYLEGKTYWDTLNMK